MNSPVGDIETLLAGGRPQATSSSTRSVRRSLLIGIAGVLVLSVFFITQTAATRIAGGREVVWSHLIPHYLLFWSLWALLMPLVVRLTRRIGASGWSWRLFLHLPAGAVVSCVHIVVWGVVMWWVRGEPGWFPTPQRFRTGILGSLGSAFTVYLAMVAGAYAFNYYRALREREVESLQLESQLAEARLHALQGQLQPHFLFNTLHAISALMEEDVQAARRMMANLSSLLRFSLEQDPGREIRLEQEIQMLRQYLEIQKTRFGDRLEVEWAVEPGALPCYVPYLILQPLVENAIRHGLEPDPGPCRIEVEASVQDHELSLVVRDDGPGVGDREIREGVGLTNTRDRLINLYAGQATLRLQEREDGGAVATITMPAREDGS